MLPLASDLEEQQIGEDLILGVPNKGGEKKSIFDTFIRNPFCIGYIHTTNSLDIYLSTFKQGHVVGCSLIRNRDFLKCTCNKEHSSLLYYYCYCLILSSAWKVAEKCSIFLSFLSLEISVG